MLRKFLFLLASCLLVCQAAFAQQVLFLSPDEGLAEPPHAPTWSITDAAYNAFSGVVGAANMTDGRRLLSSATPDASIFAGSKVVVLTTTYARINAAWLPVLRDAMLNRPDLTFVLFPDGCCLQAQNLHPIIDIINTGTGWGLTPSAYIGSLIDSPLNTNSLYAGSFSGVNPMHGGYYELLNNVPADNALYLAQGATPPPIGSTTSAYGFFVPQQRFNGGQGACVFLTADISPFTFGAQTANIASAFMSAATAANGACAQSTREPDLVATVTGPAAPTIGSPATYTLTVANEGATNSAATTATITIPAGMTIDTATLPAGCTAAGQVVTCNVAALTATTGTVSFPINVTPTQPGAVNVSASVATVAGETSTANNSTTLAVAPAGAPDLVPTLTGPASPPIGSPSNYVLTATNQGNVASTDGSVAVTLPAGMTANPATLPAGCTLAGSVITCTPGALAPGASTSWTLPLTPTQAGATNLAVAVTGVTGEANTGNNGTTFAVAPAAVAAGGLQAVPTLDMWALLAMAGLLPLLARRRVRA